MTNYITYTFIAIAISVIIYALYNFFFYNMRNNSKTYYIIFDLDETIGHFSKYSVFEKYISEAYPIFKERSNKLNLLGTYPELFRPNMINIFKYLVKKKRELKNRLKIILFTNNQGGKSWYSAIIEYIHTYIGYPLFDNMVGPYMIGNNQIEYMRTSHVKNIEDLVRGGIIKDVDKSYILFFDDQNHNDMRHKRVEYFMNSQYHDNTSFMDMYKRFLKKFNVKKNKELENVFNDINQHIDDKPIYDYENEGKKMLKAIKHFFHKNNNKTRRKQNISNNRTRKVTQS
jgi:hypothetical protein